jgi:hypothetical protein
VSVVVVLDARAVRCSAPGCGRLLTHPDSIALRVGPVCWGRTHPAWRRRRRRAAQAARRPEQVAGQLELDLTPGGPS